MSDTEKRLQRQVSLNEKVLAAAKKQIRIGREIAKILERENLTIREAYAVLDDAKNAVQTSPVCCRW